MSAIAKKTFLSEEVLPLLQKLKADTEPQFGLMTPQHMVEHLVFITKVSLKQYEPTGEEPTKRQVGFKRFIENGAVFKHRPSDKTKADLPPLKYASLEEALAQIPIAIERLYHYGETHPAGIRNNPAMGQLSFEELELFHYQHYRYHMWQFGLLEQYP